MKILGIGAQLPSRKVTNEEILSLVEHYSKKIFQGDLSRAIRLIPRLFEKSGIQSRYWLGENESVLKLLRESYGEAIAQANINPNEIDCLIFASVARGFTEPANSCTVTHSLGLSCRNFDVIDACMGWVTAMQILNDRIKAGSIRYGAIVNIEFNMREGGHSFPKNFELNNLDELSYKFPSYTLGEALTVTIVGPDDPDNFKFSFINRPDLSDLCTISLPNWSHFCAPTERMAVTGGQFQFASFGGDLHDTAARESVNAFNQLNVDKSALALVIPHTSSPKEWESYANMAGIKDKLLVLGREVGNIVTASIPFGISTALKQNLLNKNDNCLGWQGSAGMVFAAMSFSI